MVDEIANLMFQVIPSTRGLHLPELHLKRVLPNVVFLFLHLDMNEARPYPFKVGSMAEPDMATTVVRSLVFKASKPALNAAGYVADAEPDK